MSCKILTVDDSKTIRLIVAKAFKPFDCDIFEASNGVEGLATAHRERPDLVILDYTMPIMDGFEMLTKLKSDPELKSIPVIMLTAEAGRETVLRIAKAGVRDYLIKPFKEELILERVGRVIELKPKGNGAARVRRFDDPLKLLVVDDKPAILEQVRAGLADTPWTVEGRLHARSAAEYFNQTPPDLVLVSLSLPDASAYSLFQMLRSGLRTKSAPVFGLCVKTAVEEQARAQQAGFSALITKPIDFEELKTKVTRTLNLDTSYKYFPPGNPGVVLKLPAQATASMANEAALYLRPRATEAVDAGLDSMILDLSLLSSAELHVIQLGLNAFQVAEELGLKFGTVGTPGFCQDCRQYEETKEWRFFNTLPEAVAGLANKAAA